MVRRSAIIARLPKPPFNVSIGYVLRDDWVHELA